MTFVWHLCFFARLEKLSNILSFFNGVLNMYEDVLGLSIEGKCFKQKSDFKFFPKNDYRISVIYGRNGSGKSTIAAGFELIASSIETVDLKASFIKANKNYIDYDSIRDLYVFDERYIEKNIKINEAGLGTIVLFGEQVDIEKEIEQIEGFKRDELAQLNILLNNINKYQNVNNPISPDYHYSQITGTLSSDWADRIRIIKGYKKNASVTGAVVTEICALECGESLDVLEAEYKDTFNLYEKISDSSIAYPDKIEQLIIDDNKEGIIIEQLAKEIKEPILTEREKTILSIINQGQQERVEDSINWFEDKNTSFCPYCFQDVSEAYKKDIVNSITKILNKDVDEHKNELSQLYFKQIQFNSNIYQQLSNSDLLINISESIDKCNSIIQAYNNMLEEKINNTYIPLKTDTLGLCESLNKLNTYLQKLEALRIEFNNAKKTKMKVQEKLLLINKKIACIKTKANYKAYKKQKQEFDEIALKANESQEKINKYQEKINSLNADKENVGIAIDSINRDLKYIFFADSCISIELINNMYYLKSHGNHVKPKDISSGERNIIGLCYFFTQIMQKRDISNFYNQEQFIVIDDPISSFDFENKIGMLSYLKAQIKRIIIGNDKSKVIIMSHDLTTVFDLRKALEDIKKATAKETNYSILELTGDKSLKDFNKKRSEYSELLERIYNFAIDRTGLETLIIGNAMRRVLEAFSTFNYRRSIEDISRDSEILKYFEDKSQYFEALMYRLVLHGESHFLDRINSMHDGINFFDFISDDEKQKTAKSILCMMYILNREHIISHFRTIPSAISNIRLWCEDIPKNDDTHS